MENTKEFTRLKELGNKSFGLKKYDEAIKYYTDAILIPNLNEKVQAMVYSNRCLAYIEKHLQNIKHDKKSIKNAEIDAKQCIKLHGEWFKGYARLAKIYSIQNRYGEALNEYDQALRLDSGNKDLLQERSHILMKKGEIDRNDQMENTIMNKQMLKEFASSLGHEPTPEVIERMKKFCIEKSPSNKDTWLGHSYRDGTDGKSKDYQKSAECYQRAVEQNNGEAMYNLSILYSKGLGVEQNFEKSIELLKLAASKSQIEENGKMIDIGVKESEHALGHAYEYGTHCLTKDVFTAMEWYEKAMKHGHGPAANNLGLIYKNGLYGVEQDLDKAEKLFLFAINHQGLNGYFNLSLIYAEQRKPEKSKYWLDKAKSIDQWYSKVEGVPILEDRIEMMMKDLSNGGVLKYEKDNKLSIEGLTFEERIIRASSKTEGWDKDKTEKLSDLFESISKIHQDANPTTLHKGSKFDWETLTQLKDKSKTAETIYRALYHFYTCRTMLEKIKDPKSNLEIENIKECLENFAECIKIEHTAAELPTHDVIKVKEIIDFALAYCNKQPSNSEISELELNARICYSFIHMEDFESTIKFLTVSLKRFPNNQVLLSKRGCLYGFVEMFDQGLDDFKKLIQMAPKDPNYHYFIASTYKLLRDQNKAIEHYENFIKLAEKDHRHIPDVYYSIALCKTDLLRSQDPKQMMQAISTYYHLGLESEKSQLPFYLPNTSNCKNILESLIKMSNLGGSQVVLGKKSEQSTNGVKGKNELLEKKIVNPMRKVSILGIRRAIKDTDEKLKDAKMNKLFVSQVSMVAPRVSNLVEPKISKKQQQLFFNQIDPSTDVVMKDHFVEVTIISDILVMSSVMFIGEDSNFDVQRFALYNFDIKSRDIQALTFGSRLTIRNPYIRKSMDGKLTIRVDDPQTVSFNGKKVKSCGVCGVENAKSACGRCKMINYCSSDCQKYDWYEYQHSLTCGISFLKK